MLFVDFLFKIDKRVFFFDLDRLMYMILKLGFFIGGLCLYIFLKN